MSYRRPIPILADDEQSRASHQSSSSRSRAVSNHQHVEIATLSMPTVASESGVQSGDGTSFILEASSHVIDQLVENEYQQQQQYTHHQNHDHSRPHVKTPCIEGVVDLEMVSHLVTGITEEEFVDLLHQDVAHAQQHHHEQTVPVATTMEPVDEDFPLDDVAGDDKGDGAGFSVSPGHSRRSTKEDMNLELMFSGGQGSRQSAPSEVIGENRPLLQRSSNNDHDATTTACLSLSADPFVQMIAEVHHQHQTKDDHDGSAFVDEGQNITVVETIEATDPLDDSVYNSHFHGGAEDSGGGVTVSREAFLISIPATGPGEDNTIGMGSSYYSSGDAMGGAGTGANDIFVLALPEMIKSKEDESATKEKDEQIIGSFNSFQTSTAIAHNMATIAKEEIFPLINQAFAPLPSDVQHIELRVSTVPGFLESDEIEQRVKGRQNHLSADGEKFPQQEVHLDVVIDRKVPLIGYVILVSGLVALASVGAALDLQKGGVSPEMKSFWRFNSTSILFVCLTAKSFNREEFAKFTRMELWVWMPFAAVNYSFLCTAFVIALEMTSLVNAFILSNMASLIIIGSKFALGTPVLFFEGLGALIGFIGALICASASSSADSDDENTVNNGHREMMGNILAFLASVATAQYLTVAKTLRPKVDLFVFMLLIFTLSSVSILVYMTYIGQEYELSFHPVIGLFGWMNPQMDRLPLELFMAIICNGVGTTGYIAIMKYFDPVVVSMVMLMEPIIASFIGAAVGVSTLPGWVTWAGDAVVAVGSFLVISSGAKKTESIDATGALHTVDTETDGNGMTKSSMMLKSPLVTTQSSMKLKSSIKHMREKVDDLIEEVEFISVSGRHRALTASSAGGGDAEPTVIWN